MNIEITSSMIDRKTKIIYIEGINTEDILTDYIERRREDEEPRTYKFAFDTTSKNPRNYIISWLKRQKATEGSKTYGEAIRAIVGTTTSISTKYRVAV